MRIGTVSINNKRKSLEIDTPQGSFSLPFSKLRLTPTPENRITEIYVDKELGNTAITYRLESGEEESIHLDAFLDYNKDPDYMRKMALYKLTLKALEIVKESGLSKREIIRKLNTSPAQLYRLLNTANYSKTIDQMVKLLASLGYKFEFRVQQDSSPKITPGTLKEKFPYLSDEEIHNIPPSSTFKSLAFSQKEAA